MHLDRLVRVLCVGDLLVVVWLGAHTSPRAVLSPAATLPQELRPCQEDPSAQLSDAPSPPAPAQRATRALPRPPTAALRSAHSVGEAEDLCWLKAGSERASFGM